MVTFSQISMICHFLLLTFYFLLFLFTDAKVHQKNGKSKNNYFFFLKSHIFCLSLHSERWVTSITQHLKWGLIVQWIEQLSPKE